MADCQTCHLAACWQKQTTLNKLWQISEKDITEKKFMFTRNGISISIYGSGKINDLSIDPALAQNSIASSLEDIKKCINSAFDSIEEKRKRKAAFKQISEDLDVPEQVK